MFFAQNKAERNAFLTRRAKEMTKIAFYGTKSYDKIWFEPLAKEYDYQIRFIEGRLNEDTLPLSEGCLAVCTFVNKSCCIDECKIFKADRQSHI